MWRSPRSMVSAAKRRRGPRTRGAQRPRAFHRRRKCYAARVNVRTSKLYGGEDPRDVPTYSVAEAAHLAQVPVSTLAHWVAGQPYVAKGGRRHSAPLIEVQKGPPRLLSFSNLVEAFVLADIRRQHGISFPKLRGALKYVSETMQVSRPLINARFQTDGTDLFIEKVGNLVNVSRQGQTEIRSALAGRLKRVEWDKQGIAARLFPLPRAGTAAADQPKSILIDPRRGFGKTVVAGTGIATLVIAERHRAGDSVKELAEDYQLPPELVEDAIRFEYRYRAAA
jgi:uncharacterized protein (DUF433 family)